MSFIPLQEIPRIVPAKTGSTSVYMSPNAGLNCFNDVLVVPRNEINAKKKDAKIIN